jgi:hypothetical protein
VCVHGQALLTAIVCAPWKLARAASGLCFRSSSTPRLLNDSAWVMSWCGDRQGGGGVTRTSSQPPPSERRQCILTHRQGILPCLTTETAILNAW